MTHDTATVAVPVRFAGMDVLVQASAVSVAGSEPTSAADRVRDAYQRAEPAVLGMARSLAGTVDRLVDEGAHPRTVEVEFGLAVSLGGDIVVVKGTTEATLKVTLTYEVGPAAPAGTLVSRRAARRPAAR